MNNIDKNVEHARMKTPTMSFNLSEHHKAMYII